MARSSEKAAYWAGIIRRYRRSGLTQAEFCRENDITYHSLRWWLHQPRAKRAMEALGEATGCKDRPSPEPSARPQVARFLPVRIVENADDDHLDRRLPESPPSIQVLLGGGRRIAVGAGFDPELLRRVVVALELTGC